MEPKSSGSECPYCGGKLVKKGHFLECPDCPYSVLYKEKCDHPFEDEEGSYAEELDTDWKTVDKIERMVERANSKRSISDEEREELSDEIKGIVKRGEGKAILKQSMEGLEFKDLFSSEANAKGFLTGIGIFIALVGMVSPIALIPVFFLLLMFGVPIIFILLIAKAIRNSKDDQI